MNERLRLRWDKSHRLRTSGEFHAVRSEGRSWANPLLVLYVRRNDLDHSRVGISASKRIGKAVARNRARRLIREVARLDLPQIKPGFDLLLVARGPINQANFDQVRGDFEQLLLRANVHGQASPAKGSDATVKKEQVRGDLA